jgi:hypothetical protein
MLMTDSLYVLEWSPTQKLFHSQPLSRSIESNVRAMMNGDKIDFITVFVAESRDEIDAMRATLQAVAHEYVPIPFA